MAFKNRYYDQNKNHHTESGFTNSDHFLLNRKDINKWRKERKVLPPEGGYDAFKSQWVESANFTEKQDAIWWLGHATALIQINKKIILTDPVFSERASPLTHLGPKRKTPTPCKITELPRVDIIVISHNHYDHLDYFSIRQLIKRFPLVTIVVPLGLKPLIQKWGAQQVIELDWWNSTLVDGVVVTAIPAKHWSQRTLFDANRSLWCGWMMEYKQHCIYFMGDTGYSKQFSQVKERFPNIDVALIPIGCYAPRWFMSNQHIDPEQALQLFHDIGCKKAIGIHWGVFELADEPLSEPPQLLLSSLELFHVTSEQFLILKIGQHMLL